MKQIELKRATITQHISNGNTQTTVTTAPIEALKAIGEASGLYDFTEELRDHRVLVHEHNGANRSLVVEQDVSQHGSPYWQYLRTLETDQKRIDEYLAFREVMKVVERRLQQKEEV